MDAYAVRTSLRMIMIDKRQEFHGRSNHRHADVTRNSYDTACTNHRLETVIRDKRSFFILDVPID